MYESIEKQLIIQLENYEKLTLKECSLVLSAYVQNIPIPLYALQLMYDFLIGHPELDQLDAWDLSTIVWGYSYIEGYDEKELENLMKVLYPHVLDKMEEMKLYEMLIAVRAYVVTKTEEQLLIEKGIELII
jgi:hypothetical protein